MSLEMVLVLVVVLSVVVIALMLKFVPGLLGALRSLCRRREDTRTARSRSRQRRESISRAVPHDGADARDQDVLAPRRCTTDSNAAGNSRFRATSTIPQSRDQLGLAHQNGMQSAEASNTRR
ncbi:hypothetical protein PHYPSEUDO_015506 [Phytophthora pseudosyringae]|uniref:Uncharacterized protein n=1 Tax=Phytophthora pseudosyringae TaxID=221518 RepID=A0A8T1W216_9STRA|nr:hypothetical protein PHYPSEUDO_015506 [Phytophthora pseudosyringae]